MSPAGSGHSIDHDSFFLLLRRAPLSIGDAYLQHQNAAYQASLGWQDAGDFLISPHMMGKHPYGGVGGAFGLPGLSEVVWPGVPGRSLRDNESGSSSEDQVRPQKSSSTYPLLCPVLAANVPFTSTISAVNLEIDHWVTRQVHAMACLCMYFPAHLVPYLQ